MYSLCYSNSQLNRLCDLTDVDVYEVSSEGADAYL